MGTFGHYISVITMPIRFFRQTGYRQAEKQGAELPLSALRLLRSMVSAVLQPRAGVEHDDGIVRLDEATLA
jgi:hypothetical protein